MPPLFSFRLNSSIVPMVFIKRERVKWETHGEEAHRSVDRLEEIRKELAHLRSA